MSKSRLIKNLLQMSDIIHKQNIKNKANYLIIKSNCVSVLKIEERKNKIKKYLSGL